MPRVVHFEISADDPARALDFYRQVFGWQAQPWEGSGPEEYWLLTTGENGQLGINGGLMRRQSQFPGTVNSLDVASVDEFTAKVTAHGGRVVVPKVAIPGAGYIAYCQDTEGIIFGIFQAEAPAH